MIETKKIGNSIGLKVELQNANFLMIVAKKGFIMCDYLNSDTAEKLNDAACVVTGVKTFDDVLNAKIVKLTTNARELGIKEGMLGKEALKLLE